MVAVTDVDLFSHVGWRTMDLTQEKLHMTKEIAQSEPFIGFGNCVFKPVTLQDFEATKNSHGLAKLYMQAMRTHCLKDQVDLIKDLITDGFLKLAEDKSFTVPPNLPAL
jgi:hypothetical protein